MTKRNRGPADLSALSNLAPELAEMLVSVACDIALVLDDGGVIQSVAHGGSQPVAGTTHKWVGQRWADTVTGDTRGKAEEFLDDLASTGVSRLRHVNHASEAGSDIPIAYTAVRLGDQGLTLAVGRDLSAVSAMQQRLVDAQQEIERDYWQRRQVETRHRLLFQVAAEPVVILDANTFDVVDMNRAAALLLGRPTEQLTGKPVSDAFDAGGHVALHAVFASARDGERAAEGHTDLACGLGRVGFSVTPYQTDTSSVLLMLLRTLPVAAIAQGLDSAEARADAIFAGLAKRTPDAIVVCDAGGRVTLANQAFRELVQWPVGNPVGDRNLADWIGADNGGNDDGTVRGILAQVKVDGFVGLVCTRLRRQHEQGIEVELSATLVVGTDSVGFILRVSHQQRSSRSAGDGSADRHLH